VTDDRWYFRPVKIRGVILYESGRLASTFSSDRNMNYVNYRAQVGDFSEKVEIAEGRKFLSRVPSRVRAHLSMDFADKFQKYASRWKPEMTSRQVAGFGNFGSRDTTDEAGRQPLSSALTLKPPQLRALLTLGRTLGGGGGGRGCARARARQDERCRVLTLSGTHADRIQFVGTRRIPAEGHKRPRPYPDLPLSPPRPPLPLPRFTPCFNPRSLSVPFSSTLALSSLHPPPPRRLSFTLVLPPAPPLRGGSAIKRRPRDRTRKSSTTAAQMNGMPTHACPARPSDRLSSPLARGKRERGRTNG